MNFNSIIYFQTAQYLCPSIFPWVDRGPATEESGRHVMKLVGILYILIPIFDLIIVCGMGKHFQKSINIRLFVNK